MSPTSTPLLTPPSPPLPPAPPTTWQRSRPATAEQLLTDFRNTHLPQLLDAAHLTPAQRDEALAWINDECLQRYLGARDFHLAPAVKMLQETITWRLQYGLMISSKTSAAGSALQADGKQAVLSHVIDHYSAVEAIGSTANDAAARETEQHAAENTHDAETTAGGSLAASETELKNAVSTETKLPAAAAAAAAGTVLAADSESGSSHRLIRPPQIGIPLSQVENEARDGNNYVNGFDKYGRPIAYLKKRSKPHDFEANVRLLVFTLEHAISLMPAGVQQVVLILDLSNYSRANSPPLHVSRQTLHILTTYYPERLGMAFIVNAPAVFSLVWNVVYPFLNHVTREKIKFVNVAQKGGGKGGAGKNEILDIVDREVLEATYGGEFDFEYDFEAYWKAT